MEPKRQLQRVELISVTNPAPILRKALKPSYRTYDEMPKKFKEPDPLRVLKFGG